MLLTLSILTGKPLSLNSINSGLIPTSVLEKLLSLISILVSIILPFIEIAPLSILHGKIFMPGDPIKWPTKVCRGFSNNSTGVPI